jgi:hypothetical protein
MFGQARDHRVRQGSLDGARRLAMRKALRCRPCERSCRPMKAQQSGKAAFARPDNARLGRGVELASDQGTPARSEVLWRQRHGAPVQRRRGPQIVIRSWAVYDDLSRSEFPAVVNYLRLVRPRKKENGAPFGAFRAARYARKALVASLHPEALQVNTGQLRPKFPAFCDSNLYVRRTDRCLIRVGVVKPGDGTRSHEPDLPAKQRKRDAPEI